MEDVARCVVLGGTATKIELDETSEVTEEEVSLREELDAKPEEEGASVCVGMVEPADTLVEMNDEDVARRCGCTRRGCMMLRRLSPQ